MKTIIALCTLTLTLLAATGAYAELTRLSNNVYAYLGGRDDSPRHSFAANAGVIIGERGVLVVDTLMSAQEGQHLLAAIRTITDKPIRYVVNTHTHLDHVLGNGVFADLGATVIAHEADRSALASQGDALLRRAAGYGLTPEELAGTRVVVPDLAFGQRLTIDLGGEEVQLIHGSPSHTPGSLVVYLPGQKLLFSGDILFSDFHPNLSEGDLTGWCRTLDTLLAMEIQRIVPGHGPLSTKDDLREMKRYLVLFDAEARRLAAGFRDIEALSAAILKVLPRRSLGQWMVELNLKKRYLGK